MKLSKKKRIRRKQIKRFLSKAHPLVKEIFSELDSILMFGTPFGEGRGWAGNLPNTEITISPKCQTEFTITSKGFKQFHQQTAPLNNARSGDSFYYGHYFGAL